MLAQVESKSVHQEIPKLTPGCIQELTAFSVFARRSVKNFHIISIRFQSHLPWQNVLSKFKRMNLVVFMEDPHSITYKPARFGFKVLLQVASLIVIGTMPAGKYSTMMP